MIRYSPGLLKERRRPLILLQLTRFWIIGRVSLVLLDQQLRFTVLNRTEIRTRTVTRVEMILNDNILSNGRDIHTYTTPGNQTIH